jgi:hypothetical protein
MRNENEILSLFHHIHHVNNIHDVHHCGGQHVSIDPTVDYEIFHCICDKHRINKKTAVGHVTDASLCAIEIKIKFLEQCPHGGWHIESGITLIDEPKN